MPTSQREPSRVRSIGKIRLILLTALTALLALSLLASWLTHRATQKSEKKAQIQSGPVVSTRPWQTAHGLAANAATYQEALYARQAEQLADHEVDQAFNASLRCAELPQSSDLPCPGALNNNLNPLVSVSDLRERRTMLQKAVERDRTSIARLTNKTSASPAPATETPDTAVGNNNLNFLKSKLRLDLDELGDTQLAYDQATGNRIPAILSELKAHEKTMRTFDKEQNSDITLPVRRANTPWTLAGRLKVWYSLRSRLSKLQEAENKASDNVGSLTRQNQNLQKFAGNKNSGLYSELSKPENSTRIRRILSINKDRIANSKQLGFIYTGWMKEVQLQKRIVLNLVLESLGYIFAVILCIILFETLLHRLTDHPVFDRRHMQTLRVIFKVGIQVIGVLAILVLIFGLPNETGTVIGLITAALALALQDYIVAFFGWFMLTGPKGIRVGDMVEIDGVCGEVIDIGLIKTTLLETTGLQEKGEPTGRRVSLLNSFAVHGTCFNFSGEGQWLWDEITISVPATEYIYAIAASVAEIARKETAESARLAEQEWNRNLPSTSLNRVSAAPIVMLQPSTPLVNVATSINIQIRFVTRAVGRYEIRDRLYQHVIQMLQDQKRIDLPPEASPATP